MASGDARRSRLRRSRARINPGSGPGSGSVRADVTTLETFLSASALAGSLQGKVATESIAILDLASALGLGHGSATALTMARTLVTRVAMMLSKLEARFR